METSRTNLARRVIAALATLSGGATAIAVWSLTNAPEQAALRQYALATGPGAPLPASTGGALSPDGSTLALVTPSAELWLKRPGEGQATRLEGATGVVGVALSPDGGTLVWSREAAGGSPTALLTSAVENGSPVVIAENVWVNAPGVALLDDGSAIATREFGGGGGWGLIRVPRGGGEPAVVHRADSGYVATFPAALPGSRKILFIRWTFSVTQPELWGLDLVSGTARRILAATRLVAATDERTLLLLGEDNVLRVAAFDADRLALAGDATPILANARASFFGKKITTN